MQKLRVIGGGREARGCGPYCGCADRSHPEADLGPPPFFYRPRHLVVEVTNRCNLDCIMCERKLTQPDDLMPPEIFDMIAERFIPHAIATELSGLGEPTLAPDFPRMARTVYDRGNILYFPTNGAAIASPRILEALMDHDRTRVSVSMDAASEDMYGKIRVDKAGNPGDWKGLLRSVEAFRNAKPLARLTSCFTAGAYNVDEFPAFVELAASLGMQEVAFRPVRCWALSVDQTSLRFRHDRTERAIKRAVEIAAAKGILLHVERPRYADGLENAAEVDGFVTYLDVVPLDSFECGTSSTAVSCLAAGTPVGIPGKTRPIEELAAGQMVDGINEDGRRVKLRILELFRGSAKMARITHEDGVFEATYDHTIFDGDSGRVIRVSDLFRGGVLVGPFGAFPKVLKIEDLGEQPTYNFRLAGSGAYFAAGALMHHQDPKGSVGPLDVDPLGPGTGSTSSGKPTDTGIHPDAIRRHTESVGIILTPTSPRVPPADALPTAFTSDVLQILSDGTVTTCGAKHPIGHVRTMDFDMAVAHPDYQHHLRVRSIDPGLSKWCSRCEQMS